MIAKPQIVDVDEQRTAVIHLTVPRAGIERAMGPAIEEILALLAAQRLPPAGPCYSFHWKRPGEVFDFEVGFPVRGLLTSGGLVKMSSLPGGRVVRTTYAGPYEGLAAAWGEFCDWIDREGLAVGDSLWECYVVGPGTTDDPAAWRTELYRPLAG